MRNRAGFSLLELLVVVSIIGIVTGVVVASFSGGIRVWQSARSLITVEQEMYFGFEALRKDLFNTCKFRGIRFRGAEREVSFPALVYVKNEGGGTEGIIGSVKYMFSQGDKTLVRYAWPFPGSEERAQREVVAGGIEFVRFSYMDGRDYKDGNEWVGSWQDPTNFPAAVRVEISMEGSERTVLLERNFSLMEALWRSD